MAGFLWRRRAPAAERHDGHDGIGWRFRHRIAQVDRACARAAAHCRARPLTSNTSISTSTATLQCRSDAPASSMLHGTALAGQFIACSLAFSRAHFGIRHFGRATARACHAMPAHLVSRPIKIKSAWLAGEGAEILWPMRARPSAHFWPTAASRARCLRRAATTRDGRYLMITIARQINGSTSATPAAIATFSAGRAARHTANDCR